MERQWSFSVKSTRILALTITTISSAIVFLTFFSISLLKSNSDTNFQIDLSPTHINSPDYTSGSEQKLRGESDNLKNLHSSISDSSSVSLQSNPILNPTRFNSPDNTSGSDTISSFEVKLHGESDDLKNLHSSISNSSSVSLQSNPILNPTLFDSPDNTSGSDTIPSFEVKLHGETNLHSSISDSSVSRQPNPIPNPTRFNSPENTTGSEITPGFEVKLHGESTDLNLHSSISDSSVSTESNPILNPTRFNSPENTSGSELTKKKKRFGECDVTKGKWVYDSENRLYTNESCPFIDEGFGCQSNGRLDLDYMNWRWEFQDCDDTPRFNGTKMLEMIRGKRLVFVGDSINRNQWESMLCLLLQSVKDPKRVYETHNRRITKEKGNYSFRFADYKCTVEFYVTHFLVREGKARIGKKRKETLRIDAMDRTSSKWKNADFLVFNTAHWWSHYKTKSGINYYQEGDLIHPKLDVSIAFKKALQTWSSWIDKNVDPKKTRVFFRSVAPSHFSGGEWNSGGHCREANKPLNQTFKPHFSTKNAIVEEVLKEMKTQVTLLNVSGLSQYRIDAHPSIYGTKPENRRFKAVQDCSHWCLPGVPDTWNHFLYLHLLHKR